MSKRIQTDEEFEKELVASLLPNLVNSLLKSGYLIDSDLSDKKILFEKIKEYMHHDPEKINWEIFVDHRNTLIEVADLEINKGNFGLAISLYATFIEHTLNKIISLSCQKSGIDRKTQTEIIKNVNMIGKCTWLIKLLKLPIIRQEYIKTILEISDERNAYIHYKWKPEPDEVPDLSKEEKTKKDKLNKVKSLIKYLKSYETKYEFDGRKGRIKEILK